MASFNRNSETKSELKEERERERDGRGERQPIPYQPMCKAHYVNSRQFLKISRQGRKKEWYVPMFLTPALSNLLFVISFLFLDVFPPSGVLGIACISQQGPHHIKNS